MTCPFCGTPGAYQSLTTLECGNERCERYVARPSNLSATPMTRPVLPHNAAYSISITLPKPPTPEDGKRIAEEMERYLAERYGV